MSPLCRRPFGAIASMLHAASRRAGAWKDGGSGAPSMTRVGAGGFRQMAGRLAVTACALIGGQLMLSAAPASALDTHPYLCQITGTSPGSSSECNSGGSAVPGGLVAPAALAVSNGNVWVSDWGNGVVDEFGTAGAPVEELGAGVFQSPQSGTLDVAVDDATQTIYVADAIAGAVDVFDATGSLVAQWPIVSGGCGDLEVAVDNSGGPSSGDVYVADICDNVISKFDSSGNPVPFSGSAPYISGSQITGTPSGSFSGLRGGLVVDSGGNIYSTDVRQDLVEEFDQSGTFVRQFDGTGAPQPNGSFVPGAVAVDNVTGNVYIADLTNQAVDEFTSTGGFVSQTAGVVTPAGAFGLDFNAAGLGVDASGNVYVSDTANQVVDRFGPGVVAVPDVSTGAAGPVGITTATLNATVNPDGTTLTDCHFDYGTSTSYGQSAQCSSTPSGSTDTPVSADLSDLLPNTTYHFRITAANSNGADHGQDQTFTTSGPPAVCGQDSFGVGQTSATLDAQINPDGLDTTYHFEYGTTSSYGTSIPIPDADIGSTAGCEDVQQTPMGLNAGTTYHWRVVATNSAGPPVDGPDQTFTTGPALTIDSASASDLTATGVTLNAQINPLGTDTTYHFEYGITTSYGTSIPIPDADIGSGGSDVTVFQRLTGLIPNTEYHWRLVAINALAPQGIDSPDHTFVYDTAGGGLPDGRAYEMVTPVQKNGGLILNGGYVSSDGDRVISAPLACFGDVTGCTVQRGGSQSVPYLFTRTGSGWTTTSLNPPGTQASTVSYWGSLVDGGLGGFTAPTPPAGEDDWWVTRAGGSPIHVGPANPPADGPGTPLTALTVAEATGDASVLVWQADGIYPFWPFDATLGKSAVGNATVSTYEYTGAGSTQPELVGVSGGAGSTTLISQCSTVLGPLSADGRTVFFTAVGHDTGTFGCAPSATAPPVQEIFARVDRSQTVPISEPASNDECTGACRSAPLEDATIAGVSIAPHGDEIGGAASDGSKLLFTSAQQETDSATQGSANLYLYDFGQPAGHNLIDVSAGDTSGLGPSVEHAQISRDGSHVYFIAQGILTGAPNDRGQSAQAGANNLYAYERDAAFPGGHLAFVAALPSADLGGLSLQSWNVSPDGRFLVLLSTGDLTADDTSTTGAAQVFRYDAQTGGLIRVSIGRNGFNDNGNDGPASQGAAIASLTLQATHLTSPASRVDLTMSDDGSRVFFASPVGLTPQALNDAPVGGTNGNVNFANNIYEWERAGAGSCPASQATGCIDLISDGRDVTAFLNGQGSSVNLIGTDSSGANVFFTTADPLVAQDTDTANDIYDARIGGGLTAGPPPAGCQTAAGDTCQGAPGPAPPAPTVATVAFAGPGNPAAGPGKPPAAGKPTVRTRTVHGASFLVAVRVPAAGRITISGRGIGTARRSVPRAGTYRLRVRLTPGEKRALKRKHRLKLTLRVGYAPRGGAATSAIVHLTVKR